MTTRRRFLTIVGGAGAAAALGGGTRAADLARWQGVALGARATILLDHPRADRLIAMARAEIARLEAIFSLHHAESALARLNAEGRLDAPPADLLSCLAAARRVHRATGGVFDPTVQPLWALHARHGARGTRPAPAEIAAARSLTGFDAVSLDPGRIDLGGRGRALTLNGIAQGTITDRIAGLLAAEGVEDAMIEAGEIAALGRRPDGGPWRVGIAAPGGRTARRLRLSDRALATSAPMATVLDAPSGTGHILDPRAGGPAAAWTLVAVESDRAETADALSTAFCAMSRAEIDRALGVFREARIAHLG